MEPWRDLTRQLDAARGQVHDSQIVHASLAMYVERVQSEIAERKPTLQTVRGELHNPKRHYLLPGVASSRTWIKQRNAHVQTLMEEWAGPFAAFAMFENGSLITSIKPAEAGNALIVRGFNVGDESINARVALWRDFASASRVNLAEELTAPIELRDGRRVELRVRGKEIATLEFRN